MTRRIRAIWYHPKFRDAYANLPAHVKRQAETKERLVRENAFHPFLRTHKLKGRLADLYSFSVNAQYRIVFRFFGDGLIFLDIGTHDIYR